MNYDDLKKLTAEDDDDELSFDDDLSFEMGQEIDAEPEKKGALSELLSSIAPAERAFLALMVFLNVLVLGFGMLVATGRLVF